MWCEEGWMGRCGEAEQMSVMHRHVQLSFPLTATAQPAPLTAWPFQALSAVDGSYCPFSPAPKQEITKSNWKLQSLALPLSEMSKLLTWERYVPFSQEGSRSTNRNFNIALLK